MKTTFITTVIGPVAAGGIKALAEATRGLGGEWISSKVMKLDGQFSAMMKVSVKKEEEGKLRSELEAQFAELQFFYSSVETEENSQSKTIDLVIDCKDRSGLTRDINNVLFNLDLSVENMECNRYPVSALGESVFSARISLAVPENTDPETIAEEIEALAEDVRVNVI